MARLTRGSELKNRFFSFQIDLKKLLRDPPIVEMPSAEQTLQNQPFIGAMPTSVQKPLLDVSKEYMKLQGSVIYREDMKSDGIWLITNGVVKVTAHI